MPHVITKKPDDSMVTSVPPMPLEVEALIMKSITNAIHNLQTARNRTEKEKKAFKKSIKIEKGETSQKSRTQLENCNPDTLKTPDNPPSSTSSKSKQKEEAG